MEPLQSRLNLHLICLLQVAPIKVPAVINTIKQNPRIFLTFLSTCTNGMSTTATTKYVVFCMLARRHQV